MKFTSLVKRAREQGPWNCLRWLALRVNDRWQEWRLGIETSGIVDFRELGLGEECESYEAIDYASFAHILGRIATGPNDAFLDYGCGMGRATILAARRPFHRVIGVELSARLCMIAEKNLQVVQRRLACHEVVIVNADATQFAVPEDVSVVWLFNPFFGEVMNKVAGRIRESLEAVPRPITIIHVIPDHVASPFREFGWVEKTAEFRVGKWHQMTCLIFQTSAGARLVRFQRSPSEIEEPANRV